MGAILYLIIGALAGWLAGLITKGHGQGLIVNLIVGIIGAVVGGLLFRLVGMHAYGFIGSLFTSVVGAVVLLWVVDYLKKK